MIQVSVLRDRKVKQLPLHIVTRQELVTNEAASEALNTAEGLLFNLFFLWYVSMANTQIKTSIYAIKKNRFVHFILNTRIMKY